MRHLINACTRASLVLLVVVAASLVLHGQQGAAGAPKKILFLTYPGVGAPGSHGHASLPAAEEQAVDVRQVRRVRCDDVEGL